jgi:hypothetical protein
MTAIADLIKEANDPVVRNKISSLENLVKMSKKFPRIDMNFLEMKDPTGVPKFAILDLHSYENNYNSEVSSLGWRIGDKHYFQEFAPEIVGTKYTTKKASIPQGVKAKLDDVRDKFNRVYIAWEADWQTAPQGDPLLIGEIEGVYFLIDKWDTTKLESYIASEFTG